MLFVPFTVPNLAAPMTVTNPHTNNTSPSKDMKAAGWAASPGSAAPVNPPTLLTVQPVLTQPNTPVQVVQPQPQQSKQDTSSK